VFSKKFKTEINDTLNLAIPIIVGQLGIILMGVTDNVIVGKLLGTKALGAAAIGNSVAFLLASLATGGLPVIAPMVSKYLAENENQKIARLFSSTIWASIIYALVLFAINLGIYFNFELLDQPKSVEKLAADYFFIITISNLFLFLFIGLKQFTDGFSLPKITMYITIAGLVSNAVLNFVLIKGLGFFPELGLIGSAWATFFSRVIMLLILGFYICNNATFKIIFTEKMNLFGSELKDIFSKAIPSGFQFFFEIGAFTTAVIMMGWIGETALASHQIAINIASTTYMMATGIAFAGGIRVGEAWGNRSPKAIFRSGYAAYFIVFVFMTGCMLLIFFLRRFLLEAYIDDVAVIDAAMPLLIIASIFQLSDGIQVVGLGALRGLQDVKIPTTITFIAYWVVALPMGYVLGFKYNLGASGIWWGLLTGLTVSAIALYIRFRNLTKPNKLIVRIRVK
jgi:multidrug resistance protein, MATE family